MNICLWRRNNFARPAHYRCGIMLMNNEQCGAGIAFLKSGWRWEDKIYIISDQTGWFKVWKMPAFLFIIKENFSAHCLMLSLLMSCSFHLIVQSIMDGVYLECWRRRQTIQAGISLLFIYTTQTLEPPWISYYYTLEQWIYKYIHQINRKQWIIYQIHSAFMLDWITKWWKR